MLASDSISRSGGVRDPHLLRTDDGWFLQVLTDMDMSKGKWTGLGTFQFCRTSDLLTFTLERTTKTTGVFTPRHGSVIHITEQEYQRLRQTF